MQIDEVEHLFSRNARLFYPIAMKPSADDIRSKDAWKEALEKPEPKDQVRNSVIQPETNEPNHFMNVY